MSVIPLKITLNVVSLCKISYSVTNNMQYFCEIFALSLQSFLFIFLVREQN